MLEAIIGYVVVWRWMVFSRSEWQTGSDSSVLENWADGFRNKRGGRNCSKAFTNSDLGYWMTHVKDHNRIL